MSTSDCDLDETTVSEKIDPNQHETSTENKTPDFVLVYKINEDEDHKTKREQFEKKLEDHNLELTISNLNDDHTQVFVFAPKEVLRKYAEVLKIRMPLKEEYQKKLKGDTSVETSNFKKILNKCCGLLEKAFCLPIDEKKFPKRDKLFTAEFSEKNESLFDVESDNFFKQSDRILIVNYILQQGLIEESTDEGLQTLLTDNVYSGAYPLHDSETNRLLRAEWGKFDRFHRYQPLDDIKDYFGVKVALYFAWLGFYTFMLIPVSILGIICIIYGASTLSSDTFSTDICNPSKNITMCPLCDGCDYWDLTDACFYSEMTHLFDNIFTLIFSIVMSIWSVLFLNMWKRYRASIVHRWGLSNIQPEEFLPRPEYKKACKQLDVEKVSWTKKQPVRIFSAACSLFWVAILMAVLIGIFVFRISAITSEEVLVDDDSNTEFNTIAIPVVAAIIDLILILILNTAYEKVALWLTNREYHRTQSQFDDSLALKIYVFQFINYYSGFFYIAFIKGRIVGHPAAYERFLGRRLEECSPGGCLMELCIQLSVVMTGDQLFGAFTEYGLPKLKVWWHTRKSNDHTNDHDNSNQDEEKALKSENNAIHNDIKNESQNSENNEKIDDYQLLKWDIRGLFDEYLEMVVQYGFVTLFVTAFPLAPFFALINNVIELRGDAKKFLKDYRRPVAQIVKNIGIWIKIIDIIGKVAVVSNGFIIAFSSNFVPRLVYYFTTKRENDSGYLDWSLSVFNTSDFKNNTGPVNPNISASECYYPDFRWPHWHPKKYEKSLDFWHILSARLAFVLVYLCLVVILKWIVNYFVPEKPRSLRKMIIKENWDLINLTARKPNTSKSNQGKSAESIEIHRE